MCVCVRASTRACVLSKAMLPFGSIRKLTLGSNSISEHYIEYQYSENNQDYSKYLETKFLKFSALLTMHQVQQIVNGVN